ncbi:hypothetical protein [Vibrio jasicida]|uniref:hypothetical protein n=1 Tax=Vibrio jasicida TaxID=766224 RepID=UPI001641212F|nr:hypothetical protein [Vibrio jasicida]
MKLVIRQYLASLKERGELDALLPDLLSQMGFEVFLKPGVGSRQYDVDVGAVGKLSQDTENKVFLFSVKSGDLGRKDWDGGNPQDLRPSINEIIDVFIPTRIPSEYKGLPVEICLCFGGEIKEEVRANVSSFLDREKSDKLSFSEWNGDRLSTLIEQNMLREELLPANCRGLLRKSLAMLDEPDIAFKHFSQLAFLLTNTNEKKPRQILTGVRQLYLCVWILYSWCRDQDNLESAYLSAEYSLLNAWEASKFAFDKKNKYAISTLETLNSIHKLNVDISNSYLEKKIVPHVNRLYALSHAVRPSCDVDVNLKLFDVLGRLALAGCWNYWYLSQVQDDSQELYQALSKSVHEYQDSIKALITNNPILFTPYKDEQAIDIVMALWFLSLSDHNRKDIRNWLLGLTIEIYRTHNLNRRYPTTIANYAELIEHPIEKSDEYRKSVTKGSIMYPYLSAFSAIYDVEEAYNTVKKIKKEFLPHCNFQVFFLDESSEKHFYRFDDMHGGTLSNIDIMDEPKALLEQLVTECKESNKVYEMSACKASLWPIILTGCRHYRLPVPMNFVLDLYTQEHHTKVQEDNTLCQ